MRARLQPTPAGRIIDLERRADGVDDTLAAMKLTLDEIHQLLFGAKAILWFLGKVLAWIGGPSAIAAAAFVAWRFFTGH